MEWREDIQPARAGDQAARERLREYLTPFAHGVCLAWAPHHVTEQLVPRVLDEIMVSLGTIEDAELGPHVMKLARRAAQQVAPTLAEQTSSDAALSEARQVVGRLRELAPHLRERLFLRVVEGIPGPELAEVTRIPLTELRADLERAATEAARVLGQPWSFSGDGYLWDSSGAPPALLAKLELQLPALRFDPTAAPLPSATPDTAGTFQELKPVGALGGPMKKLLFEQEERTNVATTTVEVSTEPGVAAIAPARTDGPNPFEPQVRTIAASDLPAEAKGQVPLVPWADEVPPSSKSGKQPALAPRPVPAPRDGEVSGKSASGKSGRQPAMESSGKRASPDGSTSRPPGALPPMPSRAEVTKDAPKLDDEPAPTQARMPAPLARQAEQEQMLGRPTVEFATAPVGETRLNPVPLAPKAPDLTEEETRTAADPRAKTPGPLDAPLFKGGSPLFIAAALVVVGLVTYALSLLAAERHSRASWQLVPVVVAAEDLAFGDVIHVDNIAVRAVPAEYSTRNAISDKSIDALLEQRILADVQAGDPLFWSQFSEIRAASKHLAEKVIKHGRALSIPVSTTAAVGQMVHPGDRVDVLVSITTEEKEAPAPRGKGRDAPPPSVTLEPRAYTVLQNVPVLATGRADSTMAELALDERAKRYTNVTLLLTPEEAEALVLATQMGRLHLTLRAEDDDEVQWKAANEKGYSSVTTLLDGERRRALQTHRTSVIQIIRNLQPEKPGRRQTGAMRR